MSDLTDAQLAAELRLAAEMIEPEDGSYNAGLLRLAAQRLEARGEISEAIKEVLEASDEFREGMGPEWEGDPLTDACDRLRAAQADGPDVIANLESACIIADRRNEELRDGIKEAVLQIEYLSEKFGKTGTGEAVIARLRALLANTESEE